MSMTTFMIWQMIGIFGAYFGVTLILPLVVFRGLLRGRTITNQILFSFLIGNFYIITMVQILQLLKISHTITLILATVIPAYVAWVKLNKVSVLKTAEEVGGNVKRLTEKQLGVKTALLRVSKKGKKDIFRLFRGFVKVIQNNYVDILLQLFLIGVLVWCYGKGIVQIYGYSASDLPVHNYWINAMNDNHIFVAGVYPHAYHCMLYYMHTVFGFDTYILLSLFGFIQVVCLHFILLYFLKLCCKLKFIPYIGVFIYGLGDFFWETTYSRFSAPLPQEYGMIFILPCAYYGFEFFKLRYKEVEAGEKKKESWYSLVGFAMSFGMTLSAHFYNTIIAGVFCVAIAIGYLGLFVKKQYFGNIVITCLISVLVAILPMGLAFATGTPLEGSLYWARSVITGNQNSVTVEQNDVEEQGSVKGTITTSQDDSTNQIQENVSDISYEEKSKEDTYIVPSEEPPVVKKEIGDRIKEIKENLKKKIASINGVMFTYVWNKEMPWCSWIVWCSVILLLVEGLVYILLRNKCHGGMLISVAIYMFLMMLVLSSDQIGFIKLMDYARACVYFAYMVPVVFVMAIDGFCYLLMMGEGTKRIREIVSAILLVVLFIFLLGGNHIRTAYKGGSLEMNEAITVLTNILRQEKDFTWTICSANDELRMCEERGYHYEVITFLRQMENWGNESTITIPTEKVFFFIEKVPLDYGESHENSGGTVSVEAASKRISYAAGLTPYTGANRWITMSKMYYWAQEFMHKYPNEMKVYLETDRFVCYVLEQNTYDLYNLAIDYGYNTRGK